MCICAAQAAVADHACIKVTELMQRDRCADKLPCICAGRKRLAHLKTYNHGMLCIGVYTHSIIACRKHENVLLTFQRLPKHKYNESKLQLSNQLDSLRFKLLLLTTAAGAAAVAVSLHCLLQ